MHEIARYKEQAGFAPKPNSYFGWQSKDATILILDARSDNFINTEDGVIPIDPVIAEQPSENS